MFRDKKITKRKTKKTPAVFCRRKWSPQLQPSTRDNPPNGLPRWLLSLPTSKRVYIKRYSETCQLALPLKHCGRSWTSCFARGRDVKQGLMWEVASCTMVFPDSWNRNPCNALESINMWDEVFGKKNTYHISCSPCYHCVWATSRALHGPSSFVLSETSNTFFLGALLAPPVVVAVRPHGSLLRYPPHVHLLIPKDFASVLGHLSPLTLLHVVWDRHDPGEPTSADFRG